MKKQLFIILAGLALSSQPALAYYPWEMWQGSRALEAKQYALAAQRYQAALKEHPDDPQALYNLGECFYREKKYKEAAPLFKKAMDGSQTQLKGKAAYNLGNTLFREQKLEEALEAYKTALRWNEIDDDARYNIQVILDMLKKKNDKNKDNKDKNKDNKDKNKDNKDKNKDDKSGDGQAGKDKDKGKNNDDKSQAKNDDKDKNDGKSGQGKDKDKDNKDQGQDKPKDDQQGKDPNDKGGQQPPPGGQDPQQSPNNGQQPQNSGQDPSNMSRQEAERLLRYFADQEKRKMQQGKGKKAGIVGLPSGETW